MGAVQAVDVGVAVHFIDPVEVFSKAVGFFQQDSSLFAQNVQVSYRPPKTPNSLGEELFPYPISKCVLCCGLKLLPVLTEKLCGLLGEELLGVGVVDMYELIAADVGVVLVVLF